jgi:hypothetical protein
MGIFGGRDKIHRMNTLPTLALPRVLLMTTLICATGIAWAQGHAPAAPIAPPPPPSISNAAGQEQLEQSMAQGRGEAPASHAAPAAPPPAAGPLNADEQRRLLDRKTQKVEILHFEDAGNRVDEVRSGGQTQRITIQPKNGMPAYDVLPANPNTVSPGAGIGQTGPRVWRIHQF